MLAGVNTQLDLAGVHEAGHGRGLGLQEEICQERTWALKTLQRALEMQDLQVPVVAE